MCGEVVLSANYILNRVSHKKLDKTPFELWRGFVPNLQFMKVWGCLAKVGMSSFKRTNVGASTLDTAFIGYAENSASYKFLRLDDKSVCEARDSAFFEEVVPLKNGHSEYAHTVGVQVGDACSLVTSSEVGRSNEPRRSKRQRVESCFGPYFNTAFMSELEP